MQPSAQSLVITALLLTEMTYMGINSQGTSREARLGKKKRSGPAARVTRHEEILIQGNVIQRNVIQTEMLMKSGKIKRCTYMLLLYFFSVRLQR